MADICECGNEPSGSVKWGNFLTSCKPVSFSRRTLHHGVIKFGGGGGVLLNFVDTLEFGLKSGNGGRDTFHTSFFFACI